MARIRSIKPEFWTSEQITECSPNARLLFIGIWNFADDNGIHPASVKRLKMEVFPSDDFTQADIASMVDELLAVGLIRAYEVGEEGFWQVTGWHHQKIDQPTFKHPLPDGSLPRNVRRRFAEPDSPNKDQRTDGEHAANDQRTFDERSHRERKGEEGKGKEKQTRDKPADLLPGVHPEILRDFLAIRKAKKMPLTETAAAGIKREAEKAGVPLADAIRICCERGWAGFKADWLTREQGNVTAFPGKPKASGGQPEILPELTA